MTGTSEATPAAPTPAEAMPSDATPAEATPPEPVAAGSQSAADAHAPGIDLAPAEPTGSGEPPTPTPSTQRGPLAGLDDLARLLGPGSTGRKFAAGVVVGAAVAAVVSAIRAVRRR
jgi:hypothetical protein